MSELIHLNKFELISKIQSINRENNKLKTLLIRHQLLTNFYQKLYENCVQLKDLEINKNDKQLKYDLKSNQTKLLTQIRAITECDKTVSISLTKLKSEEILFKQYFIDESTQHPLATDFDVNQKDICDQNIKLNNDSIDLKISEELNHSSVEFQIKTEPQIDYRLNNEVIVPKIEPEINTQESKVSIDLSADSNDETINQTISSVINGSMNDSMTESMNDLIKTEGKTISNKVIKQFVCEYCHKSYKHKKSYSNHMNQIHKYIINESKPEISTKIDETVDKSSDRQTEELKISPKDNNLIVCQWPECRMKFKNRTLFLRHHSVHNESRKICSECGLKFNDWNRLREHMIWHSNQTNSRPEVPEVTTNQINCEQYVNGFQTSYKCDWISCDFICDNFLDLSKHYLKHNSNDGKLWCDFPNCNYKTSNANNLETHQKRAHEKVYTEL